ncbi:hypothetical protein U1Q18_036464, partial [Sarracenia purpurea var. burkii]
MDFQTVAMGVESKYAHQVFDGNPELVPYVKINEVEAGVVSADDEFTKVVAHKLPFLAACDITLLTLCRSQRHKQFSGSNFEST